jgi:hypothetical protein
MLRTRALTSRIRHARRFSSAGTTDDIRESFLTYFEQQVPPPASLALNDARRVIRGCHQPVL